MKTLVKDLSLRKQDNKCRFALTMTGMLCLIVHSSWGTFLALGAVPVAPLLVQGDISTKTGNGKFYYKEQQLFTSDGR